MNETPEKTGIFLSSTNNILGEDEIVKNNIPKIDDSSGCNGMDLINKNLFAMPDAPALSDDTYKTFDVFSSILPTIGLKATGRNCHMSSRHVTDSSSGF